MPSVIARGIIICQEKKVSKKEKEKPATNAYLIENNSQVPPRRRIASVRIVSVALILRMIRAMRTATMIHRNREYRIEKLRR
jgi:hypothetical protein